MSAITPLTPQTPILELSSTPLPRLRRSPSLEMTQHLLRVEKSIDYTSGLHPRKIEELSPRTSVKLQKIAQSLLEETAFKTKH